MERYHHQEEHHQEERERYYPYEKLKTALDYTLTILTSRYYAEIYRKYAEELVNNLIINIGSSLEGAFGVGFPFYLLSPELPETFEVEEYRRFIEETRENLSNSMQQNNIGWICPTCQLENQLPDLKKMCNQCTQVGFKPRNLFRALPDSDTVVVVNLEKYSLEEIFDKIIRNNNLMVSDLNIREAIDNFLLGVEQNIPSLHVLLDLHVVTTSTFYEALEKVRQGLTNFLVPVHSYRGRWVENELPFWYDFMLSATPLGDPSLPGNTELIKAMREIRAPPLLMLQRLQQECEANAEDKHCARVLRLINDPVLRPLILAALYNRYYRIIDQISQNYRFFPDF